MRDIFSGKGTNAIWVGGMALVVLLAIVVRSINLNSSLWYDEVFTLVNFVRLPVDKLVSTYSSLNNHPLYSLAAKGAVVLFGETPAALRLPALVAGVCAIVMAGLLARRFMGPLGALLVCLLIALSVHDVWFSQNARGYTGLLFFSMAATLLFLKGAEAPRPWTWPLYGVMFAAAHYTHLSAAFFFTGHGLIYAAALAGRLVLKKPRTPLNGVQPFIGMLTGAMLTLAAYAPMLGGIGGAFARTRATPELDPLAPWKDPAFVVQNILDQFSSLGLMMTLALPGILLMVAVGVRVAWRKSPLTVAIALLPIPITVGALSLMGMRIWPRYFFIEIEFLYLFLVLGVMAAASAITSWLRSTVAPRFPERALAAIAVAAMIGGSVTILAPAYRHPKQDLAGAVAEVEKQARPTDVRAIYGVGAETIASYYAPTWSRPANAAALAAMADAPGEAWVVVAFIDQLRAGDPAAKLVLARRYREAAVLPGTMGDGDVFIYRSRED